MSLMTPGHEGYAAGDLARHMPSAVWSRADTGASAALASLLVRTRSSLGGVHGPSEPFARAAAGTGESLAGACLLWMIDETGRELLLNAACDADPNRLAVIAGALARARHSVGDPHFATAMLSPGPYTIDPVRWGDLTGWQDQQAWEPLTRLGPAALTIIALRVRDTTPGLIALLTESSLPGLARAQVAQLELLADRLAQALEGPPAPENRQAPESPPAPGARPASDGLPISGNPATRTDSDPDRELVDRSRYSAGVVSLLSDVGAVLVVACDGAGTILEMEGGLRSELYRGRGPVVGERFLDLFRDHRDLTDLASRALGGEHVRAAQVRFGALTLEAWATPLGGGDGRSPGFAAVFVDASARVTAEQAVVSAARRQAALVAQIGDVVLVISAEGKLQYANPATERMLGYQWRTGDGIDILSLVHPEDRDRCRNEIEDAKRRPGTQEASEFRLRHADGSYRSVRSVTDNRLDDDAVAGLVLTLRDVTDDYVVPPAAVSQRTERPGALADLGRWALAGLDYPDLVADAVKVLVAQSSADFVHVFDALPDADFITLSATNGESDASGELLSADPTSSPASFALVTQQTVVSDDLSTEQRFEVPELWTSAGAVSLVEVPIPGADMPVGVIGVSSGQRQAFASDDVNFVEAVANVLAAARARSRAEDAIRQQALRDPLTGLPNRLVLADHVNVANAGSPSLTAMSGAERTVFVLDIDRFKEINDTLGHAVGDVVLLEVSRRLERLGEPIELVARLGGDEFALVARAGVPEDESLSARNDEDRLAANILSTLGESIEVGGVNLRLRCSVGIASADIDREGTPLGIPALLRRAEAAMYQAKSEHQGVRRYSDELERSSLSRLALASELAEAIDQGHLRLDYQPKVRCADGGITGVEALVRWQHPTRGLLLPDVFVPLAEQTGIIRELTSWVLLRALAECAAWHRAGYAIPVAVNLSAGTVHDPALLDAVISATSRAGLPPAAIELEITESAVMRDPAGALRSLEALTSRGVRFSLDDFGTGYSSLGYLQRLPVSSVKVDKSFVTPLGKGNDAVAGAIVRAIVELGHSLNLDVIAEGVDSAIGQSAVTALGCDAMQGFFIARPMEPLALQSWISGRGLRGDRSQTGGALQAPGRLEPGGSAQGQLPGDYGLGQR